MGTAQVRLCTPYALSAFSWSYASDRIAQAVSAWDADAMDVLQFAHHAAGQNGVSSLKLGCTGGSGSRSARSRPGVPFATA